MNQDAQKDVYRFAYNEAASELRQILISFERLSAKKEQVENLIEVLKPEVAPSTQLRVRTSSHRKNHLPDCIVVTRITVA